MAHQPFGGRERRRYPRRPAASAYWIEPREGRRVSAWLIDWSEGGAACLLPERAALRVGDCVELSPIHSDDRSVNEALPVIPRSAQVLRVDDDDARTRKVALRFEVQVDARLDAAPPLRAGAHGLPDRSAIRTLPRHVLGCPPLSPAGVDTHPVAQPSPT